MSYGWLTESSLIPRPSKRIELSSGSLESLQATIFDHEKNREKRRLNPSASKVPLSTPLFRKRKKDTKNDKDIGSSDTRNEGVDKRIYQDLIAHELEEPSLNKSQQKLIQKAKLYNELVNKKSNSKLRSSHIAKECLVNFKVKNEDESHSDSNEDSNKYSPVSQPQCDPKMELNTQNAIPSNSHSSSYENTQHKKVKTESDISHSSKIEFLVNLSRETDKTRAEIQPVVLDRRKVLSSRLNQLRLQKKSAL